MFKANHIITCCLLSLLLLSVPAPACSDEFDLFIVPTVDDQLDSWLKTTPYMQPTIFTLENIYPGQPFSLRLLFKNYSLSQLNNVFITYDVQFFDPGGDPTEDTGENLLGYKGPVKSNNYVIINQQFLRVFFDEKYPFGDYEVVVAATDQVSKNAISNSAKISLKPFVRVGKFSSFDFYLFWIKNYFRQPDPAKAVFGLLQFFENNLEWIKENRLLLSFGAQLFEKNPWIWDHLADHYQKKEEDREAIIALMALYAHQDPTISQTFSAEQTTWYDKVSPLRNTFRYPIEEQWGEFFVTGHLDPLQKIVSFLKPFALPELTGEKLEAETTEEKAFWSLVEHGPDIPIVSIYCLHMLERGQLEQQNKVQLRLALEVIQKSLNEREIDHPEATKKKPLSLMR